MTPHEQLQAIQERADAAKAQGWESLTCYRPAFGASEVLRLVAALRAVLDLAGAADAATDQVMTYGVPSGRVSTIELRRAITEALT